MKKPIDKTYLENCFKDFHAYLLTKVFHTHENKAILDKIGESATGNILFDGSEIVSGNDGIDGKSAYQIAVDNGFTGTEIEWIESLKGETGSKGDKGDKGDPGEQGSKGIDGKNGLTPNIDPETKHWCIGETDTGVIAEGKNGTNGSDGVNGQDGITPHIDPTTKHWFIGDVDTGVIAEGTKGDKGDQGANAENVTLESIGAASVDHMHGSIKTITLSTTEPETVAEGELVLVYEE